MSSPSSNLRRFPGAALCALALISAAPALAQEPREVPVSLRALDLTAPADIAVVDARILEASRNVCRRPSHASEMTMNPRTCAADAARRARAQAEAATAASRPDLARAPATPAR